MSTNFTADLKPIYRAITEEQALIALDVLEEKGGKKYPLSIKSWRTNWPELSTFFKYPGEIRRMIYTTNCIENYNRQLRKVIKTKGAFPSDDALLKLLYLATMNIVDKWAMRQKDWGTILDQLLIISGAGSRWRCNPAAAATRNALKTTRTMTSY